MPLDKTSIGNRIRKIRENHLCESQSNFSSRCNLTEPYLAKIEKGEILITLSALDKIVTATGIDTEFILYGPDKNLKPQVRKHLHTLIDRGNVEELKMYYKCVCTVRNYLNKKHHF